MPVPGPRTQFGPVPGYSNPGGELPDRFNASRRLHRDTIVDMGRTPGLMFVNLRGNILAPGQIRRLWRQAINYIAAPAPYSWTHNAPQPGRPVIHPDGFAITRALRYMTRSLYARAGEDNTRLTGLHTRIVASHRSKPVTLGAGLVRSRPTVRNRMNSFGSRVPTLNQPSAAADNAQ